MTTRVCRTAAECFTAGWDDGANDEPLTPREIERLTALHAPFLGPRVEVTAS